VTMEALTQPQHIKVRDRFYVAQFFDRAAGDVLAGPVPDVPLDRQAGSLAGQPAHQPCNGSHEGSTGCCPMIRSIRGRLSEGEGEAG
jgi:hypothetical protein